MNAPVRVIDLFAGAGGLSAGLHKASSRFVTSVAVELDSDAAATFAANFERCSVFEGTLSDWLDLDEAVEADIVIGGPPCQGFSTLGRRDAEDVWVQLEPR